MNFLTITYKRATSYVRTLWRGSYLGGGPRARRAAQNVPLIHVTIHEPGNDKLFENMLLNPPHELWVTPARDAKPGSGPPSESPTQKAERILDLGRNVYFYAGVVRDYGNVPLVFGPECAARHTGSATIFDTGKFANRVLQSSLPKDKDGTPSDETLRAFTRRNLIPLSRWLAGFRRHLAVNFSDPSDYYDGKPCTPGPAKLFSLNPDKRVAWTYEVRFQEGQDILEALAWLGPPGLSTRILSAHISARGKLRPSDDTLRPRLIQFMQRAIIRKGAAHRKEIIERAQERARGMMGI